MMQSAIILFREMLEVTLIVGMVMAATKDFVKARQYGAYGVFFGIVISLIFAFCFSRLSSMAEDLFGEIINVVILFVATIMILWTLMSIKSQAHNLKKNILNSDLLSMKQENNASSISIIIASCIIREGLEITFFFHSIAASASGINNIIGAIIGSLFGIGAGFLFYVGLTRVFNKYAFAVTNWLLVFLAASIASAIPDVLASANVVSFSIEPLWDTSVYLSEQSVVGGILKNLFGYQSKPSIIHLVVYLAVILVGSLINMNCKKTQHI